MLFDDSFSGTGVTVLGTISNHTVQISSYSIDGGAEVLFTSKNMTTVSYSQVFFTTRAGTLTSGVPHKLVITPVQSKMFIDMITYDVPALAPASQEGHASTTIAATTTKTVNSAPTTATVESCNDFPGRTSSRIGPIVGGVLGGAVFTCILFLVVAYLRRPKTTEDLRAYPFPGMFAYTNC